MVVLKRRSRLVTFRVSLEEYEALAHCCANAGARSLSEFARGAVMQNVHAQHLGSGTLTGDLATVTRVLSELDASLSETRKRIRGVLGRAGQNEAE